MAKDSGYWQAIDNLAFYIRQLSDESQLPYLQEAEWLWDASVEEQMDYCRQFMTAEQEEKWDKLEEAFDEVRRTYGTSYEETFAEVQARIWLYELESGDLIE